MTFSLKFFPHTLETVDSLIWLPSFTQCSILFLLSSNAFWFVRYYFVLIDLFFGPLVQGSAHVVRDATCWQREHEWRQDIAVVTKWLSGVSPVGSFLLLILH